MNEYKNLLNTYSHFSKSTLFFKILGQDNGNVVQCHPGGLQDGNTTTVGPTRVKWSGHAFSKSELDIQNGEEKGAPR